LLLSGRGVQVIAQTFLLDVAIFFAMTIMACITHRRLDIIGAFPLFYLLRITNMAIYVKAFFEVILLRRFRGPQVGWSTANRRYKVAEA
ncbi:MAG: hypothetical protein QG658_488, partial [Patescibacteria group bacterium]|nr:hypothetical protein [Patescibacteria group bacterium]